VIAAAGKVVSAIFPAKDSSGCDLKGIAGHVSRIVKDVGRKSLIGSVKIDRICI
jgi:hypothetical protein